MKPFPDVGGLCPAGWIADVRTLKIALFRKYVVAANGDLRLAAKIADVHRGHFYKIGVSLGQEDWLKDYRAILHMRELSQRTRGTVTLPGKIALSEEQLRG